MRWTFLFLLLSLPVQAGCDKGSMTKKENMKVGAAVGDRVAVQRDEAAREFAVQKQEAGAPGAPQAPKANEPVEKKEKPRKIRYTAEMKLVVEKIDEAEEALDAAKKEAKGEYAKVEINNSTGVVRSGKWLIRVPVENLHSFRKAVAKIGEVERNTLESEDMTAQYYDLEAHLTNRKIEQEATRELLKELGKKDARFLELKRELDAISDDINRKEGQLKLWMNITDLTTFTVHMREKQPFVPEAKVADKEIPTFGRRASTTWDESLELFLGFCQTLAIIAIAVTPWLPIPLVFFGCIWLLARRLARSPKKPTRKESPVVLEVVEEKNEN